MSSRSLRAVGLAVAVSLALAPAVGAAERKRPIPRWQTLPEVPALPTPVRELDVVVEDATVHVATFGAGRPVVLLHGGCGHGGQFGFQVPALVAAGYQPIVIDARGQGRSGLPASGLSYHAMAEDVVAVLDALALPRAAVVGWSDGAIVGLDLAMHHPDRVDGLLELAGNFDASGTARPKAPAVFNLYYARCKREQAARQPDTARRAAARAALSKMWKREPRYRADDLRAIAVPVTVVHADHDELIRADHARAIAGLIPHAALVTLTDVGHFAMLEDPAQFDQVMLAFLASLPVPATATPVAPPAPAR